MIAIKENLYWVGIKDWELKKFHGDEFATENGSTYNAYLIKGNTMTALVDTCWGPFKEQFLAHLEDSVGLSNIDCLICLHTETDHSGAMQALLEKRPGLPIYCTAKAKQFLESQYPGQWDCTTVKTGDTLDLGGYELHFIEAQMLHWPDTMFAYIGGMSALLSSDAFGQHFVTGGIFNDEADQSILWQEAIKYYANIVSPYAKMVSAKISQVLGMGLPLEVICPSHGVIWRDNPMQVVDKYVEWSAAYKENMVAIIYDTMWLETRAMAEAIGRGIAKAGVEVKLINAAKTEMTHVLTDAFRAAGVLVGSPTVNNGVTYAMAGVMEGLKHLKLTGKQGAAFGSYGWSGEGPGILQAKLEEAGIEIAGGPLKQVHLPQAGDLAELEAFGQRFASALPR
ncbi:MAG: flavodoxin domain-containing protein [Clostridiales bacterium]|nr:flavodoxin domain-containing protein [Clostridiales bacterium]